MRRIKILLLLIVILAAGARLYKLADVPPSLSWDEAAFGVNAYYLINYGRDEYGQFLPLFFRSFGDEKHPVHIYLTAPFVKIFGLNEFGIRLPAALFGLANIILLYFLAKLISGQKEIGLIAAFFLSISPYNIHFSRFNHEANFVLFFFMLGLTLFFYFIKTGKKLLSWMVLSFGIAFITYHTAKILVPIIVLVLVFLYFKKIIQDKIGVIMSLLIGLIFVYVILVNPQLLGLARITQTSQGIESVEKTRLYQLTRSQLLGRFDLILTQYSWHFTPQFLFWQGDKNPRLSFQRGEFYKIDALFLVIGLISLIYQRSKASVVLVIWALAAPLPSSLVAEAPHAARASLMMGSWHIIAATGFFTLIKLAKRNILRGILVGLTVLILSYSLFNNLNYYFGEYARRYAIEWQYGMRQIVEYVKDHQEYSQIYMTDVRHQPYIFFLLYLKTPLPQYLNTVIFNGSPSSQSYNLVSSYDKYFFGGWEVIDNTPNLGVLYIVTPSEYVGLRHKNEFNVEKLVQYPNGTDAFYLISIN